MSDIAEFRVVMVWLGADSRPATYIVHESEAERLWNAQLALHYSPGVNPHNGNQTAPLQMMREWSIGPRGPFWWSTPDLMENGRPDGARLWEEGRLLREWQRCRDVYAEGA